jgi:hypothetical protein
MVQLSRLIGSRCTAMIHSSVSSRSSTIVQSLAQMSISQSLPNPPMTEKSSRSILALRESSQSGNLTSKHALASRRRPDPQLCRS